MKHEKYMVFTLTAKETQAIIDALRYADRYPVNSKAQKLDYAIIDRLVAAREECSL